MQAFTLALVTGLSVEAVSERGVNLGWRDEVVIDFERSILLPL